MLPVRYSVNGKKRQNSDALKWHAKEGYKQRARCLIKYELLLLFFKYCCKEPRTAGECALYQNVIIIILISLSLAPVYTYSGYICSITAEC